MAFSSLNINISFNEELIINAIRSDYKELTLTPCLALEAQFVTQQIAMGIEDCVVKGVEERKTKFQFCDNYQEFIIVESDTHEQTPTLSKLISQIRGADGYLKHPANSIGISMVMTPTCKMILVVLLAQINNVKIAEQTLKKIPTISRKNTDSSFDAASFVKQLNEYRTALKFQAFEYKEELCKFAADLCAVVSSDAPEIETLSKTLATDLKDGRCVVISLGVNPKPCDFLVRCFEKACFVDLAISVEDDIGAALKEDTNGEIFISVVTNRRGLKLPPVSNAHTVANAPAPLPSLSDSSDAILSESDEDFNFDDLAELRHGTPTTVALTPSNTAPLPQAEYQMRAADLACYTKTEKNVDKSDKLSRFVESGSDSDDFSDLAPCAPASPAVNLLEKFKDESESSDDFGSENGDEAPLALHSAPKAEPKLDQLDAFQEQNSNDSDVFGSDDETPLVLTNQTPGAGDPLAVFREGNDGGDIFGDDTDEQESKQVISKESDDLDIFDDSEPEVEVPKTAVGEKKTLDDFAEDSFGSDDFDD